MARPSFSRFVYCDTNILSQLAKHRELWPPLSQYLLQHDLTLAVGGQVAELADAPRLHESLAALLTAVPAAIIKQWDVILDEEVKAHPGQRHETLLSYRLNALLLQDGGPQELEAFLSSDGLRDARKGQLASAAQRLTERPGRGYCESRETAVALRPSDPDRPVFRPSIA